MGNGVSMIAISASNEEQLIAQAKAIYQTDPAAFEAFLIKVRAEVAKETTLASESIRDPETTQARPVEVETEPNTGEPSTSNASGLQSMSDALCREMTSLRANPASFILYLEEHLGMYKDDFIYTAADGSLIKTKEGKTAVKELIEELKVTASMGPVESNNLLENAARDHVMDMSLTGLLGHDGTDKSTTKDRIERHCQWVGTIGENIDYGNTDPRHIIMHLLVDDGVPSRGHRKNILNPTFKLAGASLANHPKYKYSCVTCFAGGVKSFNEVVRVDTKVTVSSYEEMHLLDKCLNSIPGDTSQLIQEIQNTLNANNGATITLDFKAKQHSCDVEITDKESVKTMKLNWSSH
jgi:uncharacterized protein YkwD